MLARSAAFSCFVAVTLLALLGGTEAAHSDGSCDASSKCPSSTPCCSSSGYCGTTAEFCLAGCDPRSSFSPSSCRALPRCKPLSISFTNKANPTVELASYNGDSSRAPLTIDSGAVRTSKSGLYATVAQKGKAKAGTTLSTTEYIQYGRVTATLRHANNKGIVGAFILMSPTADEIDFEITGGQSRQVQLNMFAQGKAFSGGDSNSATITQGPEFDTADWHAYTLDWSPTRIIYSIDGVEVRTLKRSSFKSKKDGYYKYPATPMRAQVSVWDASDMAKGTVEWAGGRADYSKADSHGTFTTQIRSLTVECHDPESLGAGSAYGFSKSIDAKSGELKVVATSRKTTI